MGHITHADIDELLYEQHLTPEGAQKLRQKLRQKRKKAVQPSVPEEQHPVLTEPWDLSEIMRRIQEKEKERREKDPFYFEPVPRAAGRPCMFEEFQRAHPDHTGPLSLSCQCPRCSPSCSSYRDGGFALSIH